MEKTPPPGAYKPGTKLTVGSHSAVITKYISEGGFAHVYAVEISPKENNTNIACLKRVVVPDKASLNTLRAEVDSMKRLSGNRYIVSYIDSHAARRVDGEGYEVFVLMEYCANKGLIDFMNTRLQTRLTEPEVLRIMAEITEGVCNMHALQPPLIHRDIKIENVLISDNGDFKLCDFGSASPPLRPPRNSDEFAILQNDVLKNTTPQYRSPEMVDLYRHLPIDEKADIWALGVFLYKLCYYTTPFEAKGELAILHASFEFPPRPVYSDRLKNLISVLLREDPRRRPNAYQTLEEVCSMRNLPVSIPDFTKTKKQQLPSSNGFQQAQPPAQPQLQPHSQPQLPPINNFKQPIPLPQPPSHHDPTRFNSLHPVKSLNSADIKSSYDKPNKGDPFQELKHTSTLIPPAKPPRPTVASNIDNLNKSMGSLNLANTTSNIQPKHTLPPKPTVPSRSTKYVDSVVQTDDPEDVALPKVPQTRIRSSNTKRPQSMYVLPSSSSRSNSDGSKFGSSNNNSGELREKIISGLSAQTSRVELSPGENNHINSNVEFLKNLEQQDSGKSWVQQHTGGSIKSLRHISTGSKKRNSLISQFTGKFSRPQSRNSSRASSRASSIHESTGVYPHLTGPGSPIKYRSSSESIEEERIKPVEPPKLKRSSSIQRRVQALLNRDNDPPVIKTAKGYGNDALKESQSKKKSEVDQDGFKIPTLVKRKPPAVPEKRIPITPKTPPSLSAQTTPSTLTKTPSTIKKISESPSTIKKSAPPPKPKKPSYLKSEPQKSPAAVSETQTLSRTNSGESDLSISDFDEWEQKFQEKYPKAV